MIVVHENTEAYEISKPVMCPKCKRGRIGSIPGWTKASLSRRGKPPPSENNECVLVRCTICGSFWSLTIE